MPATPRTKQQWLEIFRGIKSSESEIETERVKVAIIPYDAKAGKVLLSVPLGIDKKEGDKPKLSFVGGHMEDWDESDSAASLRELKEETGFDGGSKKDELKFLGTYLYKSGKPGKNRFMPVFILPVSECEIESGERTSTDSKPTKYYQTWVSLEGIRQGKTGIDGYDLYQSCVDLFNGEQLIAIGDNGNVVSINNLLKQTALLCQQNQK